MDWSLLWFYQIYFSTYNSKFVSCDRSKSNTLPFLASGYNAAGIRVSASSIVLQGRVGRLVHPACHEEGRDGQRCVTSTILVEGLLA